MAQKRSQSASADSGLKPQPMIILHGIWMTEYKGWERKIYAAGFKFPAQHGWGAEQFNFKAEGGINYGHVEIIERRIKRKKKYVQPQLHIEKLGVSKKDDVVHNVLVVWTAPDPRRGGGRTVVGWYNNASVYRRRQDPTGTLKRKRTYAGTVCSFRATAKASDCVLLDPEERKLTLPRRQKGRRGVPGQFGAFYPSLRGASGQAIERKVRNFIRTRETPGLSPSKRGVGGRFQPDPERRREIEDKAFRFVWDHFENRLNYLVTDRQKENRGYDLAATSAVETLCIEVKGRSGPDIAADFTPNEYGAIVAMERGRFVEGSYRICVVTDALGSPKLHHFIHWPSLQGKRGEWWTLDGKHRLILTLVIAAHASVKLT